MDGKEGRFVEWLDGRWQAFEYMNYRHSFSPAQELDARDLRVLREKYNIANETLPDEDLVHTGPDRLNCLRGCLALRNCLP
jgi:hypothetical protein